MIGGSHHAVCVIVSLESKLMNRESIMPRILFLLFAGWFVNLTAALALDLAEKPAKPGEWGYRPAPGEAVVLNPPGFSWRPSKGASAYDFQVSRNEDFTEVIYSKENHLFSAHCPSRTFDPGDYHWRYRAHGEEGETTGWSQVRSFTVPADAAPFPCPAIDDWAARIPEGHPRLMFREEDLPRLRELGQGKLSDRWNEVLEQAEKLLANPPDTTEPPLYPEGTKYKSEEWKKIWWGNRLRTIAVADGAATLGFAYRLTGEEKYGEAARDLLMAMTEWDTDGSTNYQYNDEAAMPALKMTSRAYTFSHPFFDEEQQAAMARMMRARGRDCYDHLRGREHLWNPYASHSNRAWHFLGEVATVFQGEFPEAREWLEFVSTVQFCAYPVWSDSDGGWHEGTGYWSSYIGRFLHWSLTLNAIYGIDVFKRPFFQRTGYFGMFIAPPGTKTGGFGDMGPYVTAEGLSPFMELLGASAKNPHWLWHANQSGDGMEGGYLGYLFAANSEAIEPGPPEGMPESAVFRGVGVAALNTNLIDGTDNIQILFKSSPTGRQSHGYNANNAFVLNLNGERALIISGRRDIHGSPHHTEWMWESKADNSILVNGEGQIKHSPASVGEISAFKTSDQIDVVVGEAAGSYKNLDRFTRRIIFLKPHAVLIHDILDATEPSTFQFNLHSVGGFEIEGNRVDWKGKAGSLSIRFLEPSGLAFTQTDQYDTPPHDWADFDLGEWHLTASSDEKATHREFLTLIAINGAEGKLERTDTGDRKVLKAAHPDGEYTISLGEDGFSVVGEGVDWEF